MASSSSSSVVGLNNLLKASSRGDVEKCMNIAFLSRLDDKLDGCHEGIQSILSLSSIDDAVILNDAIRMFLQLVLENNANTIESGLSTFFEQQGSDVDPKLRKLLISIAASRLPAWREASLFNRVSLPHVHNIDWSLHFQRASDQVAKINVPVVRLNLTVASTNTKVNDSTTSTTTSGATEEKINFDMSREALETMLDGFAKIKEQLSQMA